MDAELQPRNIEILKHAKETTNHQVFVNIVGTPILSYVPNVNT